MFREELKRAQDRARANGEYEYHSPLGKGFTFGSIDEDDGGSEMNNNPFSKAAQGPPAPPMWLYEEGYISEAKSVLKRKTSVADRLHARRAARRDREQEGDPVESNGGIPKYQAFNASSNPGSSQGCIVM